MTDTTNAVDGAGTEAAAPNDAATNAAAQPAQNAAQDSGTLLSGADTAADKVAAAPADWPADWREKLAGDDKKALEQLKRYSAPTDMWAKTRSLEQKLSSGEYKRDVPKPEKPEDLKAWRAERGIPETPDGYKIELPNGVILSESDKPVVDAFAAQMHEKNWDNAKVNEALSWYYAEQERQLAVRAEADGQFKQVAEDELRGEWGQEYRANMTAVKNLVAGMPEGVAANLLGGRTANGQRIGDSPAMIRWLAQISRELNPAATLLPNVGGDAGKSITDRIADIEKMMGDSGSDYWRGPKSESIQSEYRTLIEARDRIKAHAA